jgi:hypothetical protein
MRAAVVVLISLGLIRIADAGDDKRIVATRALLAAQVDLWRHGNGTDGIDKFAATMTADGRLARRPESATQRRGLSLDRARRG